MSSYPNDSLFAAEQDELRKQRSGLCDKCGHDRRDAWWHFVAGGEIYCRDLRRGLKEFGALLGVSRAGAPNE